MRRISAITLTLITALMTLWPSTIGAQEVERLTIRTKREFTYKATLRAVTNPGDDPFFVAEVAHTQGGFTKTVAFISLSFEGVSADGTIFIRLRESASTERLYLDRTLRYKATSDSAARIAVAVLGSRIGDFDPEVTREVFVFRARLTDQDQLQVSWEPQSGQTVSR
jgi:hypothetical protein